jgi:hypothetical protein
VVAESITVNGVNLADFASNIEDISFAWRAPGIRNEDYTVPGRHGVVKNPSRYYEAPILPIPLFLKGVDKTTGLSTSSNTDDYLRIKAREVVALFQQDPLTIVHTYPDGSAVQAIGRLAMEPIDFTRTTTAPASARVGIAVAIPGAFWTDTTVTSQTLSGTTGSTLSFTSFSGASAPMDEMTVTFTGSIINGKIVQTGGSTLAYNDVVDAGRTAVFNPDWTFAGTGGLTMDFSKIVHFGSARFFELKPGEPPQVTLTHTGGGSASVTLSGRRKYLIG